MKKRKSHHLFLVSFIAAFFLLLTAVLQPVTVKASAVTSTKISIKLLNNGVPYPNQKVNSYNYNLAYTKITEGDYTSFDTSSSFWQDLQNQFPDAQHDKGILLPSGLQLYPGNKNSQADAMKIISFLYSQGQFSFLQILNNSQLPGVSTAGLPSNGRQVRNFSNHQGIINDTISAGPTIFVAASAPFQFLGSAYLSTPTADFTFDFENTNSEMSIDLSGAAHAEKSGDRQYTVDYGQELTYKLHINKGLITDNSSIQITPNSNLVIDDISVPAQQTDLVNQTIDPNAYLTDNTGDTPNSSAVTTVNSGNASGLAASIGQKLVNQSVYRYDAPLTSSGDDETITIHAHISPKVEISKTLSVNGNSEDVTIPINSASSPSTPLMISATLLGNNQVVSALSPSVNTSGINFAMTNAAATKFAQGAEYTLSKKVGSQTYIYTNTGWQPAAEAADIQTFAGGNEYIISSTPKSLSNSSVRFGSTSTENQASNQSLLQIRGLGKGNYFLTQTKAANGYAPDKMIQNFAISSKNEITSNGGSIVKNTIAYAQQAPYSLNGQIPDYQAGSNEYNILSVNGKVTAKVNVEKIGLLIGALIAVMLILSVFVFIRF